MGGSGSPNGTPKTTSPNTPMAAIATLVTTPAVPIATLKGIRRASHQPITCHAEDAGVSRRPRRDDRIRRRIVTIDDGHSIVATTYHSPHAAFTQTLSRLVWHRHRCARRAAFLCYKSGTPGSYGR